MRHLHCFAQSGNAYKAALMLDLCGLDWEPVFVDFFAGAARRDAFRALNPMGEVPIYVEDGLTLTQSGVILDHLSRQTGRFAGDAREVLRWTLWDNHKLTANLATARFMSNFLGPKHRSDDVIRFLLGRSAAALDVLNAHLATRDWIVGDAPTTADLSCAGYLYFRDEIALDWAAYPAVTAWADRIAALPGWRHPYDAMPGHPPTLSWS